MDVIRLFAKNPRRGLKGWSRVHRLADRRRKDLIDPPERVPEVTEVIRGRRFIAGTKYVLHPTKGWRRT